MPRYYPLYIVLVQMYNQTTCSTLVPEYMSNYKKAFKHTLQRVIVSYLWIRYWLPSLSGEKSWQYSVRETDKVLCHIYNNVMVWRCELSCKTSWSCLLSNIILYRVILLYLAWIRDNVKQKQRFVFRNKHPTKDVSKLATSNSMQY
jgi:hypothetical protein